jgi:hypothetical protein
MFGIKRLCWRVSGALMGVGDRLTTQNKILQNMSMALTQLNDNLAALNVTVAAVVTKLALPTGVAEADVAAAASAVGSVNSTLQAALNPPVAS